MFKLLLLVLVLSTLRDWPWLFVSKMQLSHQSVKDHDLYVFVAFANHDNNSILPLLGRRKKALLEMDVSISRKQHLPSLPLSGCFASMEAVEIQQITTQGEPLICSSLCFR